MPDENLATRLADRLAGRGREPVALRARYVFPVAGEPIPDGAVTIQGGRITEVGDRAPADVEDLGNAAILPGLVNAHTHLEFSDLPKPLSHNSPLPFVGEGSGVRGGGSDTASKPLGGPGAGFVDWIRRVVEYRRQATRRLDEAVELGLEESARCGTTSLGEIAQPGWPVGLFDRRGLDATVFLELIGPTANRVPAVLEAARRHVEAADASPGWRPGLSPHAPYSVHPELLAAVVALSAAEKIPLAMHLAESREELEWLRSGGGPFGDFLSRLEGWDPSDFPPGRRPLDYLRTLAEAHRTLVIHGNYLDDEEIAFLAAHADRMALVYCPRTHAHFGHAAYPLPKLLAAGVTVALGTDSRASSPDLSVLAEMRLVARIYPMVPRRLVLQLGTLRAAQALGREQEIGGLEPGKQANLTIVALPDRETGDPHELLLDSGEPVVARVYATDEIRNPNSDPEPRTLNPEP